MTQAHFLPCSALPFIPHEPPMALVDTIVECDAEKITTQIHLHETHLFAQNGRIPIWVGIEFMAQSAAAWSGFNAQKNTASADYQAPIGFLLGTRDYACHQAHFNVGDVLTVHAECLLQSSEGLGSFDCRVLNQDGVLMAQARLSVYQPRTESTVQ